MPTNRFVNTLGGEWNTAANWLLDDDGTTARVPLSTDDVVITASLGASKTITITTTAAVMKSADFSTAGNAFTLSTSKLINIYGSLTCKSGMTWDQANPLYLWGTGTLTSNGVSFASVDDFRIYGSVTLADAFTCGTKTLYVRTNGTTLNTANNNLTCGDLYVYDDSITLSFGSSTISCKKLELAGGTNLTLTTGTSTINCSNVVCPTATLTVTANTATINLTSTVDITAHFGGKTWGGTTTVLMTGGKVLTLNGANTFDKFAISWTSNNILSALVLGADQIFSNATSDALKITGAAVISRPMIKSSAPGTHRHITTATTNITGAMDFQDVYSDNALDLSAIASGNCGGNTGITFRTPANYYIDAANTNNADMADNIWATSSGGGTGGFGVFPLPQDTIHIDDLSWDDTPNTFNIPNNSRFGGIDASLLTETDSITFNASMYLFGSLVLTGSGLSIVNNSATLYTAVGASNITLNSSISLGAVNITIQSYTGTVALAANLTHTGTFTLTQGTLDLNGKTLTTNIFSSSNSNTRSLIDSAGGGKVIVKGLSGTPFTMATATNLTVSNAPDIDIGTSNLTQTGNVTFAGGGKTFGDFKVTKHAGNFTCDITGANTFGTVTQETPDATYQYAGIRFTAATTTTVAGIVADGTASYQITRSSITAATHTISDASGANTVTYNTITNEIATGGAVFTSLTSAGNVNGGGNTGWLFSSGGFLNRNYWWGRNHLEQ